MWTLRLGGRAATTDAIFRSSGYVWELLGHGLGGIKLDLVESLNQCQTSLTSPGLKILGQVPPGFKTILVGHTVTRLRGLCLIKPVRSE